MSDKKKPSSDRIDYTAEGSTPPNEKVSDTDRGYDEAAHSGASQYGTPEGRGGVFGTTGGGTFGGGMQIVERPVVYDHDDDSGKKRPGNG